MQGSFAADSVIGEVIRLKHELVENSLELVQLLNACGNRDVPGLGLTLCLRDDLRWTRPEGWQPSTKTNPDARSISSGSKTRR